MKYIHKILESLVLFIFILSFSFVSIYVPNSFNKIPVAEAGAITGGATWPQQLIDTVIHINSNVGTTVSAAADTTSAAMESASFVLDNVIDGVAWALAKNILSQMTTSIVNWVNSGFEGSPSFITDFKGFVAQIADEQFGQYLEELGGPFSFICEPFKLDVRLALAVSYEYQRANGQAPGKSTACTLSGALANIDKFIDGTDDFVTSGGWDSFFTVTQNPNSLTPIGGILSGQAEMSARIVNARGEELKLLDYGSGFLSSKVCEAVGGSGSSRENCTITTPGKVINEALTFQTSTGPQSLVAADEINEIISAVFAQLTQKALTGTAGLLGLSGGTGFSYTPVSYADELASSGLTSDPNKFRQTLGEALALEVRYEKLVNDYTPRLIAYSQDYSKPAGQIRDVIRILDEMPAISQQIQSNQAYLRGMISDFDAMMTTGLKPGLFQEMVSDFYGDSQLHSKIEVDGAEVAWETYLIR